MFTFVDADLKSQVNPNTDLIDETVSLMSKQEIEWRFLPKKNENTVEKNFFFETISTKR
jgi:hypothetical protein